MHHRGGGEGAELTGGVGGGGGVGLAAVGRHVGGADRRPRRVHVGLLLELPDVLLVADPLVAEPVRHLRTPRQ